MTLEPGGDEMTLESGGDVVIVLAQAEESLTAEAVSWLLGNDFSAIDGVPTLVAQHLGLSAWSLALALVLALPLGLWLAHTRRAPVVSINIANAFRAIPAFGLLLVAFQIGGFSYPLLVLVFALIGVAPIFANTYVGVTQVDPEIVDAAKGMGLTGTQQLFQVEIPMALPVIMAGIRTGAINIVATVTLAAIVGFGGLGLPIISGLNRGLQFSTTAQILAIGGAVLVAVLSVVTEAGLAGIQRLIVPKGLQLREAAQERRAEPADQHRRVET
ncbi:ABC transporter permease [Euzebya tangerina]|uniref:ABC transporter permease n=1 Tax=Euzebya tangerina TaxID=591198 RepID=UPI000E30D2BB|nr:ABC transporter permease [Euzebya tangerina]